MIRSFLKTLSCLLGVHLMGLLMLTLLRVALYCSGHHFLAAESVGQVMLQSTAFLRGLWFDNVIGCYILIVPLAVTVVANLLRKGYSVQVFCLTWMFVLWILCIGISAANIPYFLYFFKNINSSIWNWAEYGATTIGMLLGEKSYYPPLCGFLLLSALFVWMSLRIRNRILYGKDGKARRAGSKSVESCSVLDFLGVLLLGCASVGLCLFGIRGRMGYNPIKVSAAYYSKDSFLNQLGINPSFNLLTSTLDDRRPENKRLNLMPEKQAQKVCEKQLGRKLAYTLHPGGIGACSLKGRNVVIILMESMSHNLMGRGLTPFLDGMTHKSLYFPNCYSAGNHTNHGIFSTLYSFPALMFRNLMKGTNIPRYEGLPTVLRKNGYRTMFFMTHESQYDNMNAFLRTNGYDEIYSQENYPKSEIANSFGVQDHYLYRYALQKLAQKQQPFMATLLSISNHPPYVVPEWFHPNAEKKEEQIVEYADDALRIFFKQAAAQKWYDNTVFVLLGDHGKLIGASEDEMPQCLNHIPLMIFAPGLTPRQVDSWCMQMDVQPTLLSLLGITAEQQNFGQNVLEHPRSLAYYTADNVIGARTNGHLYIYEPATESEWFYKTEEKGVSRQNKTDSTFLQLKQTLFASLQTAQKEIRKHE